ncbi:Na/Pi cotransporter family protein [Alkalimarinus coralli]|uniref:Na/Pi cotransporter family protein n=1 Tax=Alkalimarinus coralli TaxID=2935863 RepID=UPI00202AC96D|nr:Na/Pi symporter [Alkalimarinus coralli]
MPSIVAVLGYGFWVSPDFKTICAGVAIFLFGMLSLDSGFRIFTGGVLEKLLAATTDRLWKSISFGVVSTSLMQSSSLVSVISISFLSAGLIGLYQGIGIIFGANIGTTTGAWLISGIGLKVNISAYAMPMLVFGAIFVYQHAKPIKGVGYVLAGVGFLFLGIHFMKEGFDAFRGNIDLTLYALSGIKGLLIYTLLGAAATVVMQSSHATLVLTITALSSGQLEYVNALALAIGANVGTTVTAILGALGADIQGKRLAGAHLVFNLITGLVALVCIAPLQLAVDVLAASLGIADDDYTLKLSLFHTLFNVGGVMIMLPFIRRLEKMLMVVLPEVATSNALKLNESGGSAAIRDIDVPRPETRRARYLSRSSLIYPDTALFVLIKEVNDLADRVLAVISYGLYCKFDAITSGAPIEKVMSKPEQSQFSENIDDLYKNEIKGVYSDIVEFAAKSQPQMSAAQIHLVFELKTACRNAVEALKDVKHLRKNLHRSMFSDYTSVSEQYERLRQDLIELIREIKLIRQRPNKSSLLSIDRARMHLEKADVLGSGELDQLIRERKIPGSVATSLMNDFHYAHGVGRKLINMTELLQGASSAGDSAIDPELSLDASEISELIEEIDLREERSERPSVARGRRDAS